MNSNDNSDLIRIKKQRLFELQKRAALYGINTPPEVSIEIKELQTEIAQLEGPAPQQSPALPQVTPPQPSAGVQWQLTLAQKRQLVTSLLHCPSIGDSDSRAAVIRQLRPEISAKIRDDGRPNIHVLNIVDACLSFKGGLEELIDSLRFFEDDSIQMQDVDRVLGQISSH